MGNNNQQGSSLVEVMVALFVLAIGLLGVLAMQSKSMQFNQSAHTYSQAVYLANDMAERIRTNFDQAESYIVAIDSGDQLGSTPCDEAACDPATLAAWDIFQWKQNVERSLPLGNAKIEKVAAENAGAVTEVSEHLRISVEFDDSRVVEGSADKQQYVLAVEL